LALGEGHDVLLHQLHVHAFDRIVVNVGPLLPRLSPRQLHRPRQASNQASKRRAVCITSHAWAQRLARRHLVFGLAVEREVVVVNSEGACRNALGP
jgi:hypothetical protein